MIAAIENALLQSPGVVSVSVDGIQTTWDRKGAIDELRYWKSVLGEAEGTRPRAARINLG